MTPTAEDYDYFRKMIRELCGVVVGEEKNYLISQRIAPIVKSEGCEAFSELRMILSRGVNLDFRTKIIDAITTNETSFFRDTHPFENFSRHVLPGLLKKLRDKRTVNPSAKIRIWSAASSSGQEPYSLAMLLCEHYSSGIYPLAKDVEIIGTDISEAMLSRARQALYHDFETNRGLSEQRKNKFFDREGANWRVKKELRDAVTFRHLDLTRLHSGLGQFDFVLCRNVLIYFDLQTRQKILDGIYQMMTPDSYLLLGGSENTYCVSEMFESVRVGGSVYYQKKKQNS